MVPPDLGATPEPQEWEEPRAIEALMDSPEKTELKVKLGGLLQEIREVQEHLGCPVKTDLQEIREDSVCPEHPE